MEGKKEEGKGENEREMEKMRCEEVEEWERSRNRKRGRYRNGERKRERERERQREREGERGRLTSISFLSCYQGDKRRLNLFYAGLSKLCNQTTGRDLATLYSISMALHELD